MACMLSRVEGCSMTAISLLQHSSCCSPCQACLRSVTCNAIVLTHNAALSSAHFKYSHLGVRSRYAKRTCSTAGLSVVLAGAARNRRTTCSTVSSSGAQTGKLAYFRMARLCVNFTVSRCHIGSKHGVKPAGVCYNRGRGTQQHRSLPCSHRWFHTQKRRSRDPRPTRTREQLCQAQASGIGSNVYITQSPLDTKADIWHV